MTCANFDYLKDETIALDKAGADIFHMDIVDGHYSPYITMGLNDFACVRRNTDKPLDAHLYVTNPLPLVDVFANAGADIIYIMADSPVSLPAPLGRIRELGKAPGLGLSYGTSVESIADALYMVDYVMVNTALSVGPRAYAPESWSKLEKLVELRKSTPFKIILDGAISADVIQRASAMGIDGYVLGTVGLFKSEDKRSYKEIMDELRAV